MGDVNVACPVISLELVTCIDVILIKLGTDAITEFESWVIVVPFAELVVS